MNNPFDYIPDSETNTAFQKLMRHVETLKTEGTADDKAFCRELDRGKMLGVLIAVDAEGTKHTLYAFSGQLGDSGFYHDGFVGPVFDYLTPGGYFRRKEAEISRLNAEIAAFERDTLDEVREKYENIRNALNEELHTYKEKCRLSKHERDARRKSGAVGEEELQSLIRRSQFEKAELHRLKKRVAEAIEPYEAELNRAYARLDELKEKRRSESEDLQQWLFTNFKVLNARGETRSLSEIFEETPMKIPPSGAGECCAPKLLQASYLKGWTPLKIAEYWYGSPGNGELRIPVEHYPACRGKCLPVLGWMLQGLEVESDPGGDDFYRGTRQPKILFENQWFCVVDKPAGMLSVPGKGAALSVQHWLSDRYGKEVRMAHRLDQDTSGLLIGAFGAESLKLLQSLFSVRKVKKTYEALLDGDYVSLGLPASGRIELALAPDWLDRPRQRVDLGGGKEALTDYVFTGVSEGRSRILFYPLTGRTHQLRVHAASEKGLGMPIVGDRLYGRHSEAALTRLHLHARRIEFTFPLDGKDYIFESPVPF